MFFNIFRYNVDLIVTFCFKKKNSLTNIDPKQSYDRKMILSVNNYLKSIAGFWHKLNYNETHVTLAQRECCCEITSFALDLPRTIQVFWN